MKKTLPSTRPIIAALSSIRTRYSLVTALSLLFLLAAFYIGGRIVLVHMMHDAGAKVKEIGLDVRRLAMKDVSGLYNHAAIVGSDYSLALNLGTPPALESLLGGDKLFTTLAMRFNEKGEFQDGRAIISRSGVQTIYKEDIAVYENLIPGWLEDANSTNIVSSMGVIHILNTGSYVAVTKYQGGGESGYLVLGTPFDSHVFANHINDVLSGMNVRVTTRNHKIPLEPPKASKKGIIAPMLSEALNFYSGGFWDINSGIFEATFTVRDIAGNPMAMLAISLPSTFASVTSVAISRLTLFVTIAGIIIILPIFWVQSHLLLNPLTKMTENVRKIGVDCDATDCPRITWEGRDEFAVLARSVNEMLETISRRNIATALAETRLKSIITCLPDTLAVFDKNGNIVSFPKPPARHSSIPGSFVLNTAIPGFMEGAQIDWSIYGREAETLFRSELKKVFSGGIGSTLRLSAHLAHGAAPANVFEVRFTKMDDHFVLALLRDVTIEANEIAMREENDRRKLIVAKQESMALMAAGIAHDINNILSVILNTAEITLPEIQDPLAQETLHTFRSAIKRGSMMARELMTYAGEVRITLYPCDPAKLLKEALELSRNLIPQNISVEYRAEEDLPAVDADPNQIWKIFLNLIKNASEAMKERLGTLTVAVSNYEMTAERAKGFHSSTILRDGRGLLFTIADTGPGISEDLQKRIFDPYVTTKEGGRGLGLATVGTLVEAHRGGVELVSSPGHGTAFHIYLPASDKPLPVEEVPKKPERAPSSAAKDILLVDDDQGILKTTSILLKASGYNPITASSAKAAIDEFRLRTATLRCVLLDAHIEKVDTIRLIATFRATDDTIPVIVSSGSSPEQMETFFESQPYDAFLAKPYTLTELKDAVDRV